RRAAVRRPMVWAQSPPRTRTSAPLFTATSACALRSVRPATISFTLRARRCSSSSANMRGAQSPWSMTSKPADCRRSTRPAARSRGDGSERRRQREADIFANQIEIALICKTMFGEALADLFDKNFGGGGTGGEADTSYAFEPLGIDIHGGIDQCGFDAMALG